MRLRPTATVSFEKNECRRIRQPKTVSVHCYSTLPMAGPLGLLLFEMEVARERYTRDAYTETMIEITVYKIILHNAP